MLRHLFQLTASFLVMAGLPMTAQETIPEPSLVPPVRDTPAVDFLKRAQRPFLENVWCRFTGTIRYRGDSGKREVPLKVAMRFRPATLNAEIVLPENALYRIEQVYAGDQLPVINLTLPAVKPKLGLEDLGMQPDDLTFCFLYWNLVKEWPGEEVRGIACRVLEMRHPQKAESTRVWFSREYAFPLRVKWYRNGDQEPWRSFEFTDFKRRDDFWFPKGMKLLGASWKSLLSFDEAEVYRIEEKAEPADLFQVPPATPTAAPVPAAK